MDRTSDIKARWGVDPYRSELGRADVDWLVSEVERLKGELWLERHTCRHEHEPAYDYVDIGGDETLADGVKRLRRERDAMSKEIEALKAAKAANK